jgi:predicted RNA binding protein YcfA (HicA-like mRNA interferase family)
MSRPTKTLERILRGTADSNIAFDDLCGLLRHLGFDERVKGSHHIFTRDDVTEILNLQTAGGKAKPYQVRQVRDVIVSYGLAGETDEQPPPQTDRTDAEDKDG